MRDARRLLSAANRWIRQLRLTVDRSNMAGFTIVETLIVLGIAAVILLIVFGAIPTLERNSRNNQRQQDVQTILGAVSRYQLNDSGNFPADCSGSPPCTSGGGPTTNDYFLQNVATKLTYYTAHNQVVLAHQAVSATPSPDPVIDIETVYVYNHQRCNPTGGGSTPQGAGYRDVVALYAIESGNGTHASRCQQL